MFFFFCFVLLESSGGYAETSNAFIFSLNNFERLAPFVSKVEGDYTMNAIERDSFYGPKFGSDELVIYLDADYVKDSKALLATVYSAPASVKDGLAILKGPGLNFSPDEVEVFYLDTSR